MKEQGPQPRGPESEVGEALGVLGGCVNPVGLVSLAQLPRGHDRHGATMRPLLGGSRWWQTPPCGLTSVFSSLPSAVALSPVG